MQVAPYFPDRTEVAELGRLKIEPLLVPSALKVPSAVPTLAVIHLLVQPGYRGQVQAQMAGKAVEMVEDPALADFVIGDAAFVRSQSAQPAAAEKLFLQVDEPAFVRHITPLLLSQILHRRDLFPAGSILMVGALVTGDLGEALLIFA